MIAKFTRLLKFSYRRSGASNAHQALSSIDHPSTLDLSRADVVRNPYPHYAALRQTGSVHFLAAHQFWIVLKHQDVVRCLKQPHLFSNSPRKSLDPVLVGADPPAHTRVRRILNPYFSAESSRALEVYTRTCARKLLTEAHDEREIDVVSGFAAPLTESVMGHFLGLTDEETTELRQLLSSHKSSFELSLTILDDWSREYVRRAQASTGDSLCHRLLQSRDGAGLTPEEIVSVMKILWLAGTITTSKLIVTAVLLLSQYPEIKEQVQTNLGLLSQFIEEALRLDPPEQMTWHVTTEEVEISGIKIPAGADIRFCLGAANRDPEHFVEPDRVILQRSPNDHVSFAAGPHYCIGVALGRMEARVAIETLLAEWPNFRAARALSTISSKESFHSGALNSLVIGAE